VIDVVIVLGPILLSNYLSRRFEFEADRHGLTITGNVETVIRALALTYREAGNLADCNRVLELFMTHPSLTRRVESLADAAMVPREVAYRVLSEIGFKDGDTPTNSSEAAAR
jgi:Zn-dependent protease with chaperone function